MSEIGYLLSYEATESLTTTDSRVVDGVFFQHPAAKLADKIGVFPILRAGLGLSESFLSIIPNAQVYHLGLYRDHVHIGHCLLLLGYPSAGRILQQIAKISRY